MTNKGKLLVQLAKAFTAKMYPYIFWMFVLLTSFCAFWYFEARTVEKNHHLSLLPHYYNKILDLTIPFINIISADLDESYISWKY